jgi:hypothetical protein
VACIGEVVSGQARDLAGDFTSVPVPEKWMDVPIELVLALLDLSALEEVPRETESTGKFPTSRDEPRAEPKRVSVRLLRPEA